MLLGFKRAAEAMLRQTAIQLAVCTEDRHRAEVALEECRERLCQPSWQSGSNFNSTSPPSGSQERNVALEAELAEAVRRCESNEQLWSDLAEALGRPRVPRDIDAMIVQAKELLAELAENVRLCADLECQERNVARLEEECNALRAEVQSARDLLEITEQSMVAQAQSHQQQLNTERAAREKAEAERDRAQQGGQP